MHTTQATYALARVAHETALNAFSAEVDAMDLDFDADFDGAMKAEGEVRARHGIDELRALLRAAEESMLDWSLSVAANVGTPDQVAMAREIHAKGRARIAVRSKLVDLAFRLVA